MLNVQWVTYTKTVVEYLYRNFLTSCLATACMCKLYTLTNSGLLDQLQAAVAHGLCFMLFELEGQEVHVQIPEYTVVSQLKLFSPHGRLPGIIINCIHLYGSCYNFYTLTPQIWYMGTYPGASGRLPRTPRYVNLNPAMGNTYMCNSGTPLNGHPRNTSHCKNILNLDPTSTHRIQAT